MILSLTPLPVPTFSQPEHGYELGAQAIHIYCLDIRRFTADHYADAERIMTSAERERALKFVRGKESYVASRWLLRTVLAQYTNLPPEMVEFLRTDKGKPYLPQSDIHFSLSHSGHWALLAVGKTELIGIDIEAVGTTRDLIGIAESYYHPHEFAQLQALAGSAQHDYFYRLWTLKEAFFKATGTGISAGLEKIAFGLTGDKISVQIAAALDEDGDEWKFHQWTLSSLDYCALACKSRQPQQVNWFDALCAPAFP
ncbi:4'-phosphopantetheinyl transferase family protein [Cellvibrio sp.]